MLFNLIVCLYCAIMKPSYFNRHQKLIMLLLLPVIRTQSIANMEKRFDDGSNSRAVGSQAGTPYWEFILREFVFKTISPPPPANNKLYKRLLEAPFYGGPFPALTASDDELASAQHLLSRGDVYHIANGGWIICQEGCTGCDICKYHKVTTAPTVKWTLSRIKRLVPFSRPRYDLQITVFPQADGSFHMKNLSPVSYVYVTSNTGVLDRFTGSPIDRKKEYQWQYPFGTTTSPPKILADVLTRSETKAAFDEEEKPTIGSNELIDRLKPTTSTSDPSTRTDIKTTKIVSSRKRGREIFRGGQNHQDRIDSDGHAESTVEHSESTKKFIPSELFHPSTIPTTNSIDAGCRAAKNPRLILGTDQFGEKHIIHVVGAGYLDAKSTTASTDPEAEPIHGQVQPSMVSNVVHEQEDHPLYRKILKRVMDSFNEHKTAIEKFLFASPRPGRPFIGPATFGDVENAGLTTTNYSGVTWGSDIDPPHAKFNVVPSNGDGVSVQSRDTPSSNYTTPQLQRSSTVEGRQTEPRPTTMRRQKLQRKPQLLDPSVANHFEHKMTSDAPTGTSFQPQPTAGSSADPSTASAVQISDVPGENLNEKPDGHRPQVPRIVVADKRNLDEGRARQMDSRNNSDTLILKEVARSVVNHADTLRGFVAASNSSANS